MFAVYVDDDILIRETSGWLAWYRVDLVWRNDCKEGKAVVMIRILECRRRSIKYLYRISSHNETPQPTSYIYLVCRLTVHTGIPAAPASLDFRGGLDVTFLALRDRPPRICVNKTLTHDGDRIASLTASANGTRGPPRRRLYLIWYRDQDLG
jgi:hypothetical protein